MNQKLLCKACIYQLHIEVIIYRDIESGRDFINPLISNKKIILRGKDYIKNPVFTKESDYREQDYNTERAHNIFSENIEVLPERHQRVILRIIFVHYYYLPQTQKSYLSCYR